MSIHTEDLRDIAANHGWPVCDLAADEIEDLEKACALLFAENAKLQQVLSGPPERVTAVPDGWKLVPIEPTPEMIKAGKHVKRMRLLDSVKAIQMGQDPDELMDKTAGAEYRAMLAAAPPAPAHEPLALVTPPMGARALIDILRPKHDRTSCSNDSLNNGFGSRGSSWHGRCTRCMWLELADGHPVPEGFDGEEAFG